MMAEEVPEPVEQRFEEHEEIHSQFDRRISLNENYRLQAQGALKFAAFVTGTALAVTGLLISLGLVAI